MKAHVQNELVAHRNQVRIAEMECDLRLVDVLLHDSAFRAGEHMVKRRQVQNSACLPVLLKPTPSKK